MTSAIIQPAPVRRTLTVKASPERAFEVFAARIGDWWPAGHHIGAAPLKTVTIEAGAGGRWYETDEDGTERDWGRVLAWEPPGRLLLARQLNADFRFDPDLLTEVEVRFIADGERSTRVEFEHRRLERLGDRGADLRAQIDSPGGWTGLLALYQAAAEA